MKILWLQQRRVLTVTLCAGVLLWGIPPLFALDIFGSQKSGEQEAASPERSGAHARGRQETVVSSPGVDAASLSPEAPDSLTLPSSDVE